MARKDFVEALDIDGILEVDELLGDSGKELAIRGGASQDLGLRVDSGQEINVAGSMVPVADGSDDLGSQTYRFAEVHFDNLNCEPLAEVAASASASKFLTFVTGASAAVTLTLPDAAANDGALFGVVLSDTTTNDVTIKSAGGTVGKTDRSASGAAAATGIIFTNGDDDTWAIWQSDGTNWRLAFASATVD